MVVNLEIMYIILASKRLNCHLVYACVFSAGWSNLGDCQDRELDRLQHPFCAMLAKSYIGEKCECALYRKNYMLGPKGFSFVHRKPQNKTWPLTVTVWPAFRAYMPCSVGCSCVCANSWFLAAAATTTTSLWEVLARPSAGTGKDSATSVDVATQVWALWDGFFPIHTIQGFTLHTAVGRTPLWISPTSPNISFPLHSPPHHLLLQ